MVDVAEPSTAAPARTSPGPGGASQGRASVIDAWLFRASVLLALLPVVVATVRAIDRGWLPIGDNAYFAIRARDVLTEHHPLLGTWTSASITAGTNFNNPGPLLFDVLAGPAKLVGGGAGVAFGAALLNGLAIVGIAVLARRRGGPMLGVLAMVAAAALCWSMGSELLFDPWQPHSLLLTALLLLFMVWSLACGDVTVLPWAIGVASLVIQTHLSYAILIGALGAWSAVGLGLALRRCRRCRREDPSAWSGLRRATARASVAALVVLALCWVQPFIEQVTGDGEGNLTRLVTSAGGSPETVGPALGARIVAGVVAAPPWWLRPSFAETLLPSERAELIPMAQRLPDLPATGEAVALLGTVAAVLLACWLVARGTGDRTGATAVVTAGVGLVAGLATAAALPLGFVGIAPHQFRWLWPLAAFTTLAAGACLLRAVTTRAGSGLLVPAGTLVVALVAAANLPVHNVGAGPVDDDWAIPVVRELGERMGALEDDGPLLIDMRDIRFAEPYSGPVMAELQRRGIPFVVEDEGMVRQLGESRRAGPDAARLKIREGDATREVPEGERRAVLVEGLDRAEQAELTSVRQEVLARLRALGRVPLDERGEAALARGDLPVSSGRPDALTTEPEALLATRELVFMVEQDLLDLDEPWEAVFDRYAALQRAWDLETVALFVTPPAG